MEIYILLSFFFLGGGGGGGLKIQTFFWIWVLFLIFLVVYSW